MICRTLLDRTHEGLRVWRVEGLTLLWWAEVPGVDREAPMKAWLRSLAGDEEVGALAGGYATSSAIWPSGLGVGSRQVHATMYGGDVFDSWLQPAPEPGTFYWGLSPDDVDLLVEHAVPHESALLVLIGLHDREGALRLLGEPPPQEELLGRLAECARIVVRCGHDAQDFEVWSGDGDVERRLEEAGRAAHGAVAELEWFRENRAALVWDELELAYVLPDRR